MLEDGRVKLREPFLDFGQLLFDELIADGACFIRSEIIEPFAEGEDGVDLAELAFAARLERVHDATARAAAAIARRAEGRDFAAAGEVANHLVDGTCIAEHKLLTFLFLVRFVREIAVALDGDVGRAIELGHAMVEDAVAARGTFTRGHNHACIRDREARDDENARKGFIVDEPRRFFWNLGAARGLEAREGKCVRPNVEPTFQITRMENRRKKFVAPIAKSVKDAEADIIDARFEATVKARRAPIVIALDTPGRVHLLVKFAVVSFLENLESSNADRAEDFQIGDWERRGIHVDAADANFRASARCGHLTVVARLDCLGDVFGRGRRVFAIDGDEALVANAASEDVNFFLEFIHRQHAALLKGVAFAEATITTTVHAQVGHIERREHNDAVVVNFVFDAVRRRAHFFEERGVRHLHQRGSFFGEKRLASRFAFGNDFTDLDRVSSNAICFLDEVVDVGVVDKMFAAREVAIDFILDDEVLCIFRGGIEFTNARRICHFLYLP